MPSVAVSVVVPTFNRGSALAETLRRLLLSDLSPDQSMEVIVVDDGSSPPAAEAAPATSLPPPDPRRTLRWRRQANAGPAAARNAGFGLATGRIVLFVDDDILVGPEVVRAHVTAHELRPGSVVFGLCPFASDLQADPFRRYVDHAFVKSVPGPEFVETTIIASGQISFEREQFAGDGAVYSSALVTPAAEEYELSWRLRGRQVPVLLAPHIVALHDQPVELRSYCRQQYKHGLGCAEVAVKTPITLGLRELAAIIAANSPEVRDRRPLAALRSMAKTAFSAPAARAALVTLAKTLERFAVPERLQKAAYNAAVSAHFIAGIRDGLSRFRRPDPRGGAAAAC